MRPTDVMAAARLAQARKLATAPETPKHKNTLIALPGSGKRKTPAVMRAATKTEKLPDVYDYPRGQRGRFLPMQPGQVWKPFTC